MKLLCLIVMERALCVGSLGRAQFRLELSVFNRSVLTRARPAVLCVKTSGLKGFQPSLLQRNQVRGAQAPDPSQGHSVHYTLYRSLWSSMTAQVMDVIRVSRDDT